MCCVPESRVASRRKKAAGPSVCPLVASNVAETAPLPGRSALGWKDLED